MAAHLRPVYQPKCRACGKPATEALYNTWNAHIADYCAKHAKSALREFLDRSPEQAPR